MAGRSVIVSVVAIEGEMPSGDAPPRLPFDMRMYLALERLRNRHAESGPLSRIDFDARHVAKVRSTDSAAMVAELVGGLQPDVILMNATQAWQVALTGFARGDRKRGV